MPAAESAAPPNRILAAVQGVGGLLATGVRSFITTHLLIDVLLGAALALTCFAIAAQGSWMRGSLAVAIGIGAALLLGTLLATKYAVYQIVARAVRQVGLGQIVLDALFDRGLGVSADGVRDGGVASGVHGISLGDLRTRLNAAGEQIVARVPLGGVASRLAGWLLYRVEKVAVWTTVGIVVRYCVREFGESETIDLVALRGRLIDRIDGWLIESVGRQVLRVALVAVLVVAGLAIVAALGVRQLPL